MLPPVPRCSGWAYSSLFSPSRISLPRFGGRVGLHIDLFEACSAFTRVAACTLAQSPIVTANRRLQPSRYLHDCSDCFRLERIAGWALHPPESAALSRRTPIPAVGRTAMEPHSRPRYARRVAQEAVIRARLVVVPTTGLRQLGGQALRFLQIL